MTKPRKFLKHRTPLDTKHHQREESEFLKWLHEDYINIKGIEFE